MKAINGKLDMSKQYTLKDIDCLGDHYEQCYNCGNIIKNVAIVASDTETFRIGLDCMETITSMHSSDKQEARNRINRNTRFMKMLKTQATSITLHPLDPEYNQTALEEGITHYFRVYKGRVRTEWDSFALGQGLYYGKTKQVIGTLNIPVTTCIK